MALLHFDGFDLDDTVYRYGTSGTPNGSTTTRLSTGRSIFFNTTGAFAAKQFPAMSQVFCGIAVSFGSTPQFAVQFLRIYGDAGATHHLGLSWSTTTTLALYRGTTLIASGTANVPTDTTQWAYIEMSATIADSGGRCVVKVDGSTVIDFTGDTKNGGTATSIDTVSLGRFGLGAATYFDDYYVSDSTGSAPHNTFLGPVRVYTLSPSGAGTETQMTPSAGANYACVDEQPMSTADYVTGSTGQRDTYAMSDLPGGVGTIFGTDTVAVAKKTDAGALSLKTAIRSGGTVYTGTATALSATDSTISTVRTVDPATGSAWTSSGVNAVEAGAEVV